ncbi:HlyD family efflux transporter periplasmic adaptor subunit [Chlorogloeopsis sp. ULAP01]|uniref:HlyD family efflux transporter periplasmic adaptor subunit n=1 Tax=Chlorogloeopsis sp. ULAP01 TaxID=3056483 RepID=UPI0025AA5C84|nr:HlyD family efflux transporter periplasmic adaptor subunit [Chlorogloeopsis sp. ULAP01]MDM9381989.1 HlyD family efflux transporter periplasmic adaptor subunit [Chlorogloeopsis sp. ULAP01]
MNGNSQNGKHQNGNTPQNTRVLTSTQPKSFGKPATDAKHDKEYNFEQSVVLRQSPIWSRTIMMSLIGLACFGIGWAYFAKIEQVVPATGQLKPEGTVKEIQAPVSGVIKEVYIKDGQEVKLGDLLLTFDSTTTNAELNSLKKIRTEIVRENQIYRQLLGASSAIASELEFLRSKLPQESAFLLKSRAALVVENELLRTQLKHSTTDIGLGVDEQQRLQAAKKELDSRTATAKLDVEQTKKQLVQTQIKIQDTKDRLAIQQKILNKLQILAEEGGISQLQYLNQQQQVQNLKAEIAQLTEEEKRLQYQIEQGQEKLTNTVATYDKNILDKIADNKKRIAEIDSQFTKILLDNEKRLADINSKISQTEVNIKYQELRAPVSGTIFDLQAKAPGFVANSTQKLLQIVPNDKFVAEVFITNKDIGFVRKSMKADVRIDSFPFSEFGDIKGEVISVASDALPPDQTYSYYRFPAQIRLNKQYLVAKDKNIPLQSGMSISANIKIREERSVISLLTELFTKQIESLKEVR